MNDEQDPPQDQDIVKVGRMELALKASNEGIWDWWTDRKEIYYTRRILEFFECGRKQAPNLFLPPHDHIHPDDHDAFRKAVAQALQLPAGSRVLGRW